MKYDFSNRVGFVSGGTKGIGKEISLLLAELGAKVITNYSKDDAAAEKLEAEIIKRQLSKRIIIKKSDISDQDSIDNIIKSVENRWNLPISLLVNNAGILNQGNFFQLKEENWYRTFDVNIKAPFFTCQKIMKIMGKHNGGSIVNISSIGGQTGGDKAPDYASTKGALITFTHSMARIGAEMGIRVNAVSPGWIDTGIFTEKRYKELEKEAKSLIPLKRLGKPKEIAKAVIFLLSDNASYITGQTLNINGGMLFS
jgi:NAD(P)-dependent dehydrogenase (short-subunit alcohol dehydrogenase family)